MTLLEKFNAGQLIELTPDGAKHFIKIQKKSQKTTAYFGGNYAYGTNFHHKRTIESADNLLDIVGRHEGYWSMGSKHMGKILDLLKVLPYPQKVYKEIEAMEAFIEKEG